MHVDEYLDDGYPDNEGNYNNYMGSLSIYHGHFNALDFESNARFYGNSMCGASYLAGKRQYKMGDSFDSKGNFNTHNPKFEVCHSNSEDPRESCFNASNYTNGNSKAANFALNYEQPEPTFYPLADPRPVEAHE